ncbi:phage integrase central domain-containing protein [Uliginosibacterium gangwonense]|uniref:phage integrase central domain-containing protein n=1 Tax=Uliginosibacterium gangwonense TaxID=392736 RepID=UPI003CCBEDEE
MTEITAPEIFEVLRRVDGRGARYTAHILRSEISQCPRYAIATGRVERDLCPDQCQTPELPHPIRSGRIQTSNCSALTRACSQLLICVFILEFGCCAWTDDC